MMPLSPNGSGICSFTQSTSSQVSGRLRVGKWSGCSAHGQVEDDVALAPTVRRGVDSEAERVEPRGMHRLEFFGDPVLVAEPVQLEDQGSGGGGGDVVDTRRSTGDDREAAIACCAARHFDVALGVEAIHAAHGRDDDGRGERHSQKRGGGVDRLDAHEHALLDGQVLQRAPIPLEGCLRGRTTVAYADASGGTISRARASNIDSVRYSSIGFGLMWHSWVAPRRAAILGRVRPTGAARATENTSDRRA